MKRNFRIDLFDQSKYRLETKSGMKVVEYVVLKSNVRQPVICVVENNLGDHETAEFTIDGKYNCTEKETTWDLVMIPVEPYVSDDFQIGPNGAYEHVEQVKMPIREHCTTATAMQLYKETGKSIDAVERALEDSAGHYEIAYKLLTCR
jgi:hypothetical protein